MRHASQSVIIRHCASGMRTACDAALACRGDPIQSARMSQPAITDAAPINPPDGLARNSYMDRIGFVVELATRLHIYGTTAQRLEGAVSAVAQRLGLRCNPWSNPTGMILSFSDADDADDSPLLDTTQVIRLEPGSTDLRKLCAADAIAEDVLAGRSDLAAGSIALHALDRPPGSRARARRLSGRRRTRSARPPGRRARPGRTRSRSARARRSRARAARAGRPPSRPASASSPWSGRARSPRSGR